MEFHIRAKMRRTRSECRDGAHAAAPLMSILRNWRGDARVFGASHPLTDPPNNIHTITESPIHLATQHQHRRTESLCFLSHWVACHAEYALPAALCLQGLESCALLMRLRLIWLVCFFGFSTIAFYYILTHKIGSRKSDVLENWLSGQMIKNLQLSKFHTGCETKVNSIQ